MLKKLLLAASAIILLAAACNNQTAVQPNPTPPNPSPTTQTPSSTPPADETANWKTYTNSTIGFSFKYPANWYVNDSLTLKTCCLEITNYKFPTANDSSLPGQIKIQIQTYSKTALQSLSVFASRPDELTGKIPKTETVAVAGIQSIKSNFGVEDAYYLPRSATGGVYIIIFSGINKNPELQLTSEQILSTFKFTK